MKAAFYISCAGPILIVASCIKFVDVLPTDRTTKATAFKNVDNAATAVNGMYFTLSTAQNCYSTAIYTDLALLSDEMATTNASSAPFATNSVTPVVPLLGSPWKGMYEIINDANSVMDNLPDVPDLGAEQMSKWMAEAKFIRAVAYIDLVQLFGKVPKITSSAWIDNSTLPRSPTADIYSLILQDLKDAAAGLPHDYGDPLVDRIRATRGAANAQLTYYYMLQKDWANAVASATAVISDAATYTLEANYNDVFTENSMESILEFAYDPTAPSGLSGAFGLARGRGAVPAYGPSPKLMNAFLASPGDKRFGISVAGNKVSKYPDFTSRHKYLRLGDLLLLRAEAEAQLNNLSDALADLNRIRSRAGVTPSTAVTQSELLLAIENERFLELAFEGHRWFDLVRTGRADAVMSALRPQTWQPTDVLLPVPQGQIDLNPALLPQNAPF